MIARAKVIRRAFWGFSLLLIPSFAQTTLHLTWDPSSDAVQGYKLYSIVAATSQTSAADIGPSTTAAVSNLVAGQTYRFHVTAYDTNAAESDPSNTIEYTAPQNTNAPTSTNGFLQADITTRGNWKGIYGRDGYWVVGAPPQLPSYASVTTSAPQWVWTTQPNKDTAPYLPGNTTNRIAACWYSSTNLDFNVTIQDNQFHRVSIYMLDWSGSGRRAQVEVINLQNGAIMDSRRITNYFNGVYLTWQLTGAFRIRLTPENVNAVVSAIYFDPPTTNGSGSGPTNRPPTLQPIPNQFADEGRPLQITMQASDPDPGQSLRYSLGTNVPSGATINTNTGVFTWTPAASQAPSTNQITLIATDSGSPAMSASQTFTVVVRPGAFLAVSTAGTGNLIKGTVQVNPRGTLNPEGTKYIFGTSVTATATPQSGAYFSHWEHNGGRYTQNPITFSMNGNQSLTAYFGVGGIKTTTTLATTETLLASDTTTAVGAAPTTSIGSASSDDTNLYVLEASTNLVEWTAVTNVVATTNQVDTNAVFRIRPAE